MTKIIFDEELESLKGYEGLYEISKDGDIWNCRWKRFLKCSKNNNGYLLVHLIDKDGKPKTFPLHRLLFLQFIDNPDNKPFCDHSDGNKLNNNLLNLRPATKSENNQNRNSSKGSTSKYLGVCWHKESKKWHSQMKINNKVNNLGYFDTENEAAIARNDFIDEYELTFARKNIISD